MSETADRMTVLNERDAIIDPERSQSHAEPVMAHLWLIAALYAGQFLSASSRMMIADNNWHFRLARDIVERQPVWWAAVDGNRLFPDLPFSIVAAALPGGTVYSTWLIYYGAIYFVALYLSVLALAHALSLDRTDKYRFLLTFVVMATIYPAFLPYWGRWIFDPGNHGGGAPVAILCIALILGMINRDRLSFLSANVFLIAGSLLVGSNRYLLIAFIAPLVVAVLALLIKRAFHKERLSRAIAALPVLILMTGVGGYLCWRFFSTMSWHVMLWPGGFPVLPSSDYLGWVGGRFQKEVVELARAQPYDWDIRIGIVCLIGFVGYTVMVWARLLRRKTSPQLDAYAALAATASASGLAAILFLFFMVEDIGGWRYRYLAFPTLLGLVFVSLTVSRALPWPRAKIIQPVILAGLVVVSAGLAYAHRLVGNMTEAVMQGQVDMVERMVSSRLKSPRYFGLAEYWIAADFSARSKRMRLGFLDPLSMKARFIDNNANDFCLGQFSFVIHNDKYDQPPMADIIAKLGEPEHKETFHLWRHENSQVSVLFYPSALLMDKIIRPAWEDAKHIFPSFTCEQGEKN